ncbi:hypothetical protein NKV53_06565 [Legionella sp. 27cVA30]|nr:hypothetical protein [Legionella sp. 27cVA30]MCP0914012.1 hypothetical protein [Legionella sp. 27cVA30]
MNNISKNKKGSLKNEPFLFPVSFLFLKNLVVGQVLGYRWIIAVIID